MSASIASSTGLRPTTHSAPEPGRPVCDGRARRPGDLARRLLSAVRWMVRPVLGLGRRTLALQAATHPAPRSRAVGFALAADRTLALAVARHQATFQRGPCGVSDTSTPS